VIALVAVVIIAGMSSFFILRDDDDENGFPSEAKAPKLHVGMEWWYHVEENIVDHETGDNETYDIGSTRKAVVELTSYGGKEAYAIDHFDAKKETTRHSESTRFYTSVNTLNLLDDEGNESVVFNFPLSDGKQWNWTDDDENDRTYVCNAFMGVETFDRTYDTYRIRMRWSEENGALRWEYRYDIYYSPELGYTVRVDEMADIYHTGDPYRTETRYYNLASYGTSDSDGDGLSDAGETWFGSDPSIEDTDSDGLSDLDDCVPLFDIGHLLTLTYVSTDEDVESFVEVSVYGEEEGADFYFQLTNDETDDEIVTDPIENTDTSDLSIIYRIDSSDERNYINMFIRCYDADDGNADDEIDISPDDMNWVLTLRFHLLENNFLLDSEHEMNGNGDGDYDATLRFIVSEVDMEIYN